MIDLRCILRCSFFVCGLGVFGIGGCDGGIFPLPPDDFASDGAPAWSPDGHRVAYFHVETSPAREGGYPTGLYVLDLETGERTLVVEGNANNPDWSPNGERLAFDAGDVFTVRPDGTDMQQVTNFGSAFFPAWSPNGERIAYDTSYEDPHGAKAVWIIRPDGTDPVDVSEHGTGEWRDPDWSPSGDIVHLRFLTDVFGEEIFLMDSTGANPRRLTFNEKNDRYPAWSPDGEWIAWTADPGLWLMRSDGSEQQRIVVGGEGFPSHPSWAPDSDRLVFTTSADDRSVAVLWSVRRDGSDLQQLTF